MVSQEMVSINGDTPKWIAYFMGKPFQMDDDWDNIRPFIDGIFHSKQYQPSIFSGIPILGNPLKW